MTAGLSLLLVPVFSILLQLNAVCFAERRKQYIFPMMSKDVCSGTKPYNKHLEGVSTIRLGDQEGALSVCNDVQHAKAES